MNLKSEKIRFLSVVAVTITVSSITVSCATQSKPQSLKLGSLLPVTGDAGSVGEKLPEAVSLAVTTINACGGVNEQPVELVQEDTKTDPNTGAAAMAKLIKVDEVAGVVGAWSSGISNVTVDLAVDNKVMQISPGSTSPALTQRSRSGEFKGYWARTVSPDTYQAQALAKLANSRGFDRVSTVAINNEYGKEFEKAFVQSFQALGGTVVNKNNPVRYDPNPSSLDSIMSNLFADDPDAILGVLYGETGQLLLRSAHQQGLSQGVTPLLTDGVYSQSFVDKVGTTQTGASIIGGALGTAPGANGAGLETLNQKWQENVGGEVAAFVPQTWDATVLMMLAAELGGENTGTAIKENLRAVSNAPGVEVSDPCEAMRLVRDGEEINYQGASGAIELDEYGDTVGVYDVWEVNPQGRIDVIDQVEPMSDD
ncbi:MAG: ABC transporter substrate-binding protein [Halothece sp.]